MQFSVQFMQNAIVPMNSSTCAHSGGSQLRPRGSARASPAAEQWTRSVQRWPAHSGSIVWHQPPVCVVSPPRRCWRLRVEQRYIGQWARLERPAQEADLGPPTAHSYYTPWQSEITVLWRRALDKNKRRGGMAN